MPETSVFIDRVYLGNAPVTASKLTPGSHHLNLSATGYEGISEDIVVGPGEKTVSIRFKDVHLDAKVEVVHKHGVGSCTGALIATLEGLRYETANKNDAFAAPLADLEVFEVDYLNKNLKVKLKKGRTFNFADSEGNADRLFVFQREVDKVRQRLKGSFK